MVVLYANHLAEKGHKVRIVTNIFNSHLYISSKVKIEKIPYRHKTGTILWAIVNKIKADLIIADIIVMAVLLSIRNYKRVLYFAQDYDVSYYNDILRKGLIALVYFIGLRMFKIPCIAVSDSLKDELSKYSKNNLYVVHNGIDLEVFFPNPEPSLLKLKEDRKAILIFGRKDYRKGLDIALKVISELSNKINKNSLEIWVVGDKVDSGLLPYRVRNFGYVDETKLRDVLSSADLFLYPSRHEGLPLFVLEAMACGCPVVTTKAVSIVTHMENAWVSEIEDVESLSEGVLKVFYDDDLLSTLLRNAFILVKQYNFKDQSEKFEKILEKKGTYENNS
jgi:glycosyltransferase involved in cell wall biosynthesis